MIQTTVSKIKVGIVGGAGYTGGELLRVLINHPQVEISFVNSASNAGNYIYDVHTDLFGDTVLKFSSELSDNIDVLFLCVGHGDARKFLEANPIADHVKIIDLSQDFRLKEDNELHVDYPSTRKFTYGLPELNRECIRSATNIANPGCFASSIELGLLPLAQEGLLNNEVHINATTGSTGAGQQLSVTSHFTWRNNNISVYKAFNHQHLNEISETLNQLQNSFPTFPSTNNRLSLIPNRGAFSRGIIASMYTECTLTQEAALELYTKFYAAHPFTHVTDRNIDLKQVVNTNKCLIQIQKHGDKLLIISIVDNLLKGASGQAVQNMNLMFGLDEITGLRLKANAF
ncbi:MAG: N-acetyl-gamma-glutamyl-phosphate reductase [Sphingobacteriaceae bacterium]